jgi:hypothetical protein
LRSNITESQPSAVIQRQNSTAPAACACSADGNARSLFRVRFPSAFTRTFV